MKGFTIIEMLVVIALMAIAGTIITGIFISSLKGSEKAKYLAVIKQNGQVVLDVIDKTIRNADNVVCSDLKTIVIAKDGKYARFRFVEKTSTQNGSIIKDEPSSFTNTLCLDLMPGAIFLTDTDTKKGVSIDFSNSLFESNKGVGYKTFVTINFVLTPPIEAPLNIQIDNVVFKTAIELR